MKCRFLCVHMWFLFGLLPFFAQKLLQCAKVLYVCVCIVIGKKRPMLAGSVIYIFQ